MFLYAEQNMTQMACGTSHTALTRHHGFVASPYYPNYCPLSCVDVTQDITPSTGSVRLTFWHLEIEVVSFNADVNQSLTDFLQVTGSEKTVQLNGFREEAIEVNITGHNISLTLQNAAYNRARNRFLIEFQGKCK